MLKKLKKTLFVETVPKQIMIKLDIQKMSS